MIAPSASTAAPSAKPLILIAALLISGCASLPDCRWNRRQNANGPACACAACGGACGTGGTTGRAPVPAAASDAEAQTPPHGFAHATDSAGSAFPHSATPVPVPPATALPLGPTVPWNGQSPAWSVSDPTAQCFPGGPSNADSLACLVKCHDEIALLRDQVRNMEQQIENERRSSEAVMLSVQVLNEDRQQARKELEAIRTDLRRRDDAAEAQHQMDLESLDSLSRLIQQLPAEGKSLQHSEVTLPGVDEQADE